MKGTIKRITDIIASSILGILSMPLVLMISLLILITMGRPIFFRQKRPGYKGHPFNMYKFRTMTNNQSEDGQLLPDKDRLTRLGRFLRLTSLDELPEIFNVLKGDMSLVGPRPLAMIYLNRYNSEQMRRHDVKPGITGWAQVNGRNLISWEDRFNMDVWYVDHHNFWLDVKILLITIKMVIIREGVIPEGRSAMQDFMGSNKQDVKNENSGKVTG